MAEDAKKARKDFKARMDTLERKAAADPVKLTAELLGPDTKAWKRLAPGGERARFTDFLSAGLDASILIPGAGLGVKAGGKLALKGLAKTGSKKAVSKASSQGAKLTKREVNVARADKYQDKLDNPSTKAGKLATGHHRGKFNPLNSTRKAMTGKTAALIARNAWQAGGEDLNDEGYGYGYGGGTRQWSGFGGGYGGGGYGAEGVGARDGRGSGFGKLNNSARGDYVNL